MAGRPDVEKLISATEASRRALEESGSEEEVLKALLSLAVKEILVAAEAIDCPYCRRHMELEAGELRRVLERIEKEGNRGHKHGAGERLSVLWTSLKIFYYVVLGGLRRAGII